MVAYVIGHKNPDTDSVCAAIALADLFRKLGADTEAAIQGEVTPETRFVLEKFSLEKPVELSDGAGQQLYLVDHSDTSQSADNIDQATVLGIVDHHKLGDITTQQPLEAWIWPVGASCSVIAAMYEYYNVPIEPHIAGGMLSAILSDTVIFKSATSTDKDRIIAEQLAEVANIQDIKEYGVEMFKVKSAIEDSTAAELLQRDYKDFDMNNNKVGIGQLELVDLSMVDSVRSQLFEEVKRLKEEGRHSVFLLLTDIMKEGSELMFVSDNEDVVEKAFGVVPEDNKVWLDSVMSRKKQVVPPLEEAFNSL